MNLPHIPGVYPKTVSGLYTLRTVLRFPGILLRSNFRKFRFYWVFEAGLSVRPGGGTKGASYEFAFELSRRPPRRAASRLEAKAAIRIDSAMIAAFFFPFE